MAKQKNQRMNIVYSTNPDFDYQYDELEEPQTLEAREQKLTIRIDKKARAGKEVTLIEGFIGKADDLKQLEKKIKTKCAVGGSSKDNIIIIQGNFKEKITVFLRQEGYFIK